MAILSSDKKSVTVEKGDTLWDIAEGFLGSGSKYKSLAAINDLVDPDLIYPGEIIYLYSGSVPATKTYSSKKAVIKQFGVLSTSEEENELFATWTWSKESQTESYKVEWTYDTGDGLWLSGSVSTNTVDKDNRALSRQSRYTIPTGARRVRFRVKPISKKDGKEKVYWTASWSDSKYYTDSTPLSTPSAPSDVTIDDLKLTVTMDNFDSNITKVEFQIVRDNDKSAYNTSGKLEIRSSHRSYSCNIVAGSEYKVRCRVWDEDNQKSDWSQYSNNVSSKPSTPSGFKDLRATSETSVYLEWETVKTAKTYEIEYATEKNYFDLTDQTTTVSGITLTKREIVGLQSGDEYFFRFRAVNESGVASDWSSISSIAIGEKPEAPTTWSSTTTAIVDEDFILYWLHNSKDGSYQTWAEIELVINGTTTTKIEKTDFTEDDADTVATHIITAGTYSSDTKLEWRVRTRGVISGDSGTSEWSVWRTVQVYSRPEVALSLYNAEGSSIDTIESFPIGLKALASPPSQTPIGFYLTITSDGTYETTDHIGNHKTVSQGEIVYSKHFDARILDTYISAGDVDLENGESYTITCTASFNSGLTAEHSLSEIPVSWTDIWCEPNAEIRVDQDTYAAYITPYCDECQIAKYRVSYESGIYIRTNEPVSFAWGEQVSNARTTTGEDVYLGSSGDDAEIYFCEVEEATAITDVWLSVYRREFDGRFTEIASGLDAANRTTVTDPHPALDFARYRIVATDKNTGTVSYNDLPGYAVGGAAVIVQWNEQWSSFEVKKDEEPAAPSWAGSLLKLPYNVDISNSVKKDATLVEYIGRAHPVSYYGTQIGESSSWKTDVIRSDAETIYGLRRLAKWMGDVYIRHPSGIGYWANVQVSDSDDHLSLVVPVTLDVTRVEGGI